MAMAAASSIRGDEDLYSVMDEMMASTSTAGTSSSSTGQGQGRGQAENSGRRSRSSVAAAAQGAASSSGSRESAEMERRAGVRLLPEVEGYGGGGGGSSSSSSVNIPSSGAEIWNPYIHVTTATIPGISSSSNSIIPTNPEVELCRRRAYEKFKRGYYSIFKSTAEMAMAAEGDATLHAMRRSGDANNKSENESDQKAAGRRERTIQNETWGELPSHAILERWHFATKLEEEAVARANRTCLRQPQKQQERGNLGSYPTGPPATSVSTSVSTSTATIRDMIVAGRANGTVADPVLVSLLGKYQHQKQQHRTQEEGTSSIKDGQNKQDKKKNGDFRSSTNCPSRSTMNSSLLREEIIFQWKRERRRKIGAAAGNSTAAARELQQLEEELRRTFSSNKFSRRVSGINRAVKDLAREVGDEFVKELSKRVLQRATSSQPSKSGSYGKKRKKKRDKSIPQIYIGGDHDASKAREVTVSYGGLPLRINGSHYAKLQTLFDRFNGQSQSYPEHRDAFASALFSLLVRYDMLEGGGLQSSLTGAVFDILLHRFDCRTECFASPFNSRYEHFCSAFPDTDGAFGSLGSFFEFHPTQGCFQANPPFVADFIDKMRARMDTLLVKATSEPLMFIVFVPAWSETSGWQALNDSAHLTRHVLLSQISDPHYYCEGTQHRRQGRYRIATFDTSVFFLQNAKATRKWPVTDTIVCELKTAFSRNPDDGMCNNASRSKSIVTIEATKRSSRESGRNIEKKRARRDSVSDVVPAKKHMKRNRKSTAKQEISIGVKNSRKRGKRTFVDGSSKELEILSAVLGDAGGGDEVRQSRCSTKNANRPKIENKSKKQQKRKQRK